MYHILSADLGLRANYEDFFPIVFIHVVSVFIKYPQAYGYKSVNVTVTGSVHVLSADPGLIATYKLFLPWRLMNKVRVFAK